VAAEKRVEYAEEVYSTTISEDKKSIRLLCPTKKVMGRGDTLNLSTLSIVCAIFDFYAGCALESSPGCSLTSVSKGPSFIIFRFPRRLPYIPMVPMFQFCSLQIFRSASEGIILMSVPPQEILPN